MHVPMTRRKANLLATVPFAFLAATVGAEEPLWLALRLFEEQEPAVVVIGRFDGRTWTTPFPTPGDGSEAPPAPPSAVPTSWWAGSPPPPEWYEACRDGSGRTVRLGSPRRLSGCTALWALGVDADGGCEGGSDGLVTSRAVRGLSFRIEDEKGARRQSLMAFARPTLDRLERNAAFEDAAKGGAPALLAAPVVNAIKKNEKAEWTVKVHRSSTTIRGKHLIFVQATRDYRRPHAAFLGSLTQTAIEGWIEEDDQDRRRWLWRICSIGNEAGPGLEHGPIGAFEVDGRVFVAVTRSHNDSYGFQLWESVRGTMLRRFEYRLSAC